MFTLDQAMKIQRGRKVLFYSFFNLGARCGKMVKAMPPANLTLGKRPIV